MRGDDEAAGQGSAVARARHLQPVAGEQGRLLGGPVPLKAQREMNAVDAQQAKKLQENLDRRMADKRMVQLLSQSGFAGPHYVRFEDELARYGISVLRGWLYSGYVFKLVASRGFDLKPHELELEELAHDSDLREELAMMTVARALPVFRQRALVEAGWRAEGGASIATYFMGASAYQFPNEYRRHRVQQKRWRRSQATEQITTEGRFAVQGVAEEVVGKLRVLKELQDINDPRTQVAVALTIDGYTQEEIQQLLDATSIRAIEGLLYRWRTKAKQHEGRGFHG
ncbi:hypothetical protein LIX60_31185 [Streptomyces sp. S07_1.15]|uniref:hypothetical protein n=1 Tax=Streptomyces sp. S07_1.15 TaxID=2873925 RepID=UPI001D142D51|nr:hypothetical protein [Streptomyces sp. S07_1.15]MCC3655848.1 hypothetical protein [Streptomyces sp. S07_1.15]